MSAMPIPEEPAQRPPAKVIPLRPTPTKKRRHRVRRFLRWAFRLAASLVALSLLATVSLNWWTPPATAFMAEAGLPVVYQYVSIDHTSRFMVASALVHEDDQLGTRFGAFDVNVFIKRVQGYNANEPNKGGSTIPQQLMKNVYLWPNQDWFRKGIEAGLAEEVDFTVPKKRIMELYLNYAQFGPKLFGICAASWYYFNTPPFAMTPLQAAELAAVMPNPEAVKRAPEGGIDLGPTSDQQVAKNITWTANEWMPTALTNVGGWQMILRTIGITDTATDHADSQNSPDACGTMPQAVTDRLKAEGAK